MEQIKSFADACKVMGYDPEKVLPDVSFCPEKHRRAIMATSKLFIIVEALNFADNGNKVWEPDWNNYDEEKRYPWVDLEVDENNPSGFRLNVVLCDYTLSYVGSRLVYRNSDLARYAFTQFEELYKDFFLLK